MHKTQLEFELQANPSSGKYTVLQRLASILNNGAMLFAVGSVSSVLGVVIINMLLFMRNVLNLTSGIHTGQQIWGISVAHGVYMATSGNARYQVIGGIVEEQGINKLFAQQQTVSRVLSFVIRTVNTYFGSVQWVDFLRYLDVQEA